MIQYCIKYPKDKVLPNENNKCSLCGGNCTEEGQTYARKCDVTGEGMNEGYCFRDGEKYFKYEQDLIAYLRSQGDKTFNDASDEFILAESHGLDEYYWTEWEQDDHQYIVKNGILTEIEN